MTAIDWRSPLRCPRCEAAAGQPCSVLADSSSEVLVTVRCGTCGHEWKLERETPPLSPRKMQWSTPEDASE